MSTVLTASTDNGLSLPGLESSKAQLVSQLVQKHGLEGTISALARMSGYVDVPPTINQFIDDEQFLGTMLGKGLFRTWRVVLNDIFPNQFYSPYLEVILSGAIGTGKTTCAIAGVLYDLCKLSFLKNPQEHFKLLKSTIILFAVINATKTLAEDVLFAQLDEWIASSPYFRTLANRTGGNTRFPNRIDIMAGSRFDQTMGRAIVGAVLDEANFQKKITNQASDNYNSIRARIESRFLGKGGSLPAHMWLVSSKADEEAWLQTHINKVKEQPQVKVVEYPIWEVLKEKGIYSGKTFKVFVGDKTRDPFIVERPEQIHGIDDALIIDVPIEYQQDFVNDIYRSLQDLAGSGTWSSFKFLPSAELVEECQIRENPVTKSVITLDFFDRDQKLIDYINYDRIALDNRPRFIHIDIGLKHDKTGICATRFGGIVTLKRTDPRTGMVHETREPIFYVDWMMAIEPRPGHEVALYKIKDLLIDLRKRTYPIAAVSTDGFQSANLRQDLTLLGFDTELLSVDKKRDPYDYMKNVILESRLNGTKHEILDKELRNLIDLGKKIDHPTDENASKDLADAVCGSIWLAYTKQDTYANIMSPSDYMQAMDQFAKEIEGGLYGEIFRNREASYGVYH